MQKFFTRLLAVCVVAVLSAFTATAVEFPTDGSPIEVGVVYDVVAYHSYKATLTPTASGTLIQDGCPELKIRGLNETFVGWGGSYGQVYSWQVEAGKTYEVSGDFVMSSGKVVFYMENEVGVQLVRVEPGEGAVISPIVNLTGDVLLQFNTSVFIGDAYLCVGNEKVSLVNSSLLPNTVALRVRDAMNTLYANGTLSRDGGEAITIEVSGLQSTSGSLYNGDGKLSVNYIASPQLTDLVSTNIPRELKSYYPIGDPEGIWTFVFDRNIKNDGRTWLSIDCGNPMNDNMYYQENIYPTIDGATLTFDLTGKVRELSDYIMAQEVRYVAVKLNNVRDTEGNLTIGSGSGNVGSYDYSLSYEYLQPQNLVCEFDPPTGTSLVGVDEIEIWYSKANMIEFEGVEFDYHTDSGYESVVVLKSELDCSLENNEMTIRCRVPETVKGHDQITVKLYNMQSLDGYDYRIQAQYDMFVVDLLSPIKQGEAIASTGTDDFVFYINLTDRFFYLRYDFYNGDGPDGWVYGSELHKQDDGTWTGYNGDFKCYTNFEPYILVSAYYHEDDYNYGIQGPAETYKFTFVGTSSPFAFSDIKFVSIDPEPNTEITPADDFCFTVTYDGIVNIDGDASGIMRGMGMGVEPFARIEPVYDADDHLDGYASVWRLYPPMWLLEDADAIDISIFAKDEGGKVVEGNLGAGEWDCMQFSYPIHSESSFVELTVSPADFSTVQTLSTFVISYPGMDVGLNYSYTDDVHPRLLDENWNVIQEYGHDNFALSNEGEYTTLVLTIPQVTDKGTYTLFIPEGYMLIGDQFAVYANAAYFGTYTVTGGSSIIGIITDDTSSATEVYNLQGMRIDASKLTPGLYIINGQKVRVK